MSGTLLTFHQNISQDYPTLLSNKFSTHIEPILTNKIGTASIICYEKQVENGVSLDVLLGFKTSHNNLNALIQYLLSEAKNGRTDCFISLLKRVKSNSYYWPVKLYWLSFDCSESGYPFMPSFCLSTQHKAFKDEVLLSNLIDDVYKSFDKKYQYIATDICKASELTKINHLGFTFAREELRFKFTYKLCNASLYHLLDKLSWPGDYDELAYFYQMFSGLLHEAQVSLSFQCTLTPRIEIEFPWLSENNNYLSTALIEQLHQFFDVALERIHDAQSWYENKQLNEAALYFKATLERGKNPLLKVYFYHQLASPNFFTMKES